MDKLQGGRDLGNGRQVHGYAFSRGDREPDTLKGVLDGKMARNHWVTAAAAKSLQSCPTVRHHRRQPTRLLCPWDSPGKNTGVGHHVLLPIGLEGFLTLSLLSPSSLPW